jgi:hypothetical protein
VRDTHTHTHKLVGMSTQTNNGIFSSDSIETPTPQHKTNKRIWWRSVSFGDYIDRGVSVRLVEPLLVVAVDGRAEAVHVLIDLNDRR